MANQTDLVVFQVFYVQWEIYVASELLEFPISSKVLVDLHAKMTMRLKPVVYHIPNFLSHGIPLHVADEVFKAVGGNILLHPVLVCKPL